MAQQVKIAGALFNDVPYIQCPDVNDVYHSFYDTTISSNAAAATDIASGKKAYVNGALVTGSATAPVLTTKSITANGTYNASSDSADGYSSVTVNVSSGASNVVVGTFTAGTAGAAQTLSIDYSGSGYPVSLGIYPNDGFVTGSSVAKVGHQYAIICFFAIKSNTSAPDYSGSGGNNQCYGAFQYKSNASTGTANGATRINASALFNSASAVTSAPYFVRINSKNSLSLFVSDTSYGFLSGVTYKYVIVYSS